jgi:hypothetical protein
MLYAGFIKYGITNVVITIPIFISSSRVRCQFFATEVIMSALPIVVQSDSLEDQLDANFFFSSSCIKRHKFQLLKTGLPFPTNRA